MDRWFRWYGRTCEDGKFRVVARNASVTVATVIGVWAALLEDASHTEHRGIATRGDDFWGAVLDLTASEVRLILKAMDCVGLISMDGDDVAITNWCERQFETDKTDPTNAKRQQRWRDKHKTNGSVTERNGTVTEEKRPDTDTEKKESCPVATATRTKKTPRGYSEEFEIGFWQPYPRTPNMSKMEAWREWQKLDPGDRLLACKAIELYKRFLRSKPDLETIHACRFLSKRRFDGYLAPASQQQTIAETMRSII